jgi:hypothetical protein
MHSKVCVSSKLNAVIGIRRIKRASLLHFVQGMAGRVFGDRGARSLIGLFLAAGFSFGGNRVPSSRYLFECSLVLRVGQLGGELAAFGGKLSILGDGFMHGSPGNQ